MWVQTILVTVRVKKPTFVIANVLCSSQFKMAKRGKAIKAAIFSYSTGFIIVQSRAEMNASSCPFRYMDLSINEYSDIFVSRTLLNFMSLQSLYRQNFFNFSVAFGSFQYQKILKQHLNTSWYSL